MAPQLGNRSSYIGYIVLVLLILGFFMVSTGPEEEIDLSGQAELKSFSSCSEVKSFVNEKSQTDSYTSSSGTLQSGMAKKAEVDVERDIGDSGGVDYSKTNVQVKGVDEPDIVKTDGKRIYTVTGNKVAIAKAYPAEEGKILSEIEFKDSPRELFINNNKLVVFGRTVNQVTKEVPTKGYGYRSTSNSFLKIYDVSNGNKPELVRNITMEGSYTDSRMIGDYVYAIADKHVYSDNVKIPEIKTKGETKSACDCNEVKYFDIPDNSYKFSTILSVNIQNDNEEINSKVFLMGDTQNLYVSQKNIYVTYQKRLSQEYVRWKILDEISSELPNQLENKINQIRNSDKSTSDKQSEIERELQNYFNKLPEKEKEELMKKLREKINDIQEELAKETEKTFIHRISIGDGKIEYKTNGEVPGRVLNQFSMGEKGNYFRIATTTGHMGRSIEQSTSLNHLYTLNKKNLEVVGKIEDMAKGESIYSARFIGDRCYLVTFRKTDPFFVIDLKDPKNPEILGKLKLPGYSDYLHPYDENHIIGIGKSTVAAEEGDFAWYQGLKLSMFDVSNVNKPKEVANYVIGDRGTESPVLNNHKALLFDKSKNLLSIPVKVAKVDESQYEGEVPANTQGEFVGQGAFVFKVTKDNFKLRGNITHLENKSQIEKSGYYFSSPYSIKRSLFIGEVLYTVSNKKVKANNLNNLKEIKEIMLPYTGEDSPYYRME